MKPFAFLIIIVSLFSCKNSPKRNMASDTTTNWELGPFAKPKENPVLSADSSYIFNDPMTKRPVRWQKADVFNPAAIVRHDTVFVLFRAEDNPNAGIGGRTSRIGLSFSTDGLHFKKYINPIIYPDSSPFMQYDFPGGCEDPRIVEKEDGTYVLTYTSWDKKLARLSVATSKDLYHWEKQGPVFAKAYNGKYLNVWSKSGSIVTYLNRDKNRLLARKINGKYWMYYGERDINIATSDDLINWTPVENEKGELVKAISPRKHKFDSEITEAGPPALLTNKGIVLLFNGKNAKGDASDRSLAPGTYCGGQALFDSKNPTKLMEETNSYFIKPDLPNEISGQYAAGTTFIEGLVYFKGQWILYYGTADSMVGVAVMNDH